MKKIVFVLLIAALSACTKDAGPGSLTLKLTPTVRNNGALSPAYVIHLDTSEPGFSPKGEMVVFYEFDEYMSDGVRFVRKIEYKATYQKGTALSDMVVPNPTNQPVLRPMNLKITNAYMNGEHNYQITW